MSVWLTPKCGDFVVPLDGEKRRCLLMPGRMWFLQSVLAPGYVFVQAAPTNARPMWDYVMVM